MTPKMGRPYSENPKKLRFELRLNKEQANLLQECSERLNISRTEVLLKGIQLVKDEINKK